MRIKLYMRKQNYNYTVGSHWERSCHEKERVCFGNGKGMREI